MSDTMLDTRLVAHQPGAVTYVVTEEGTYPPVGAIVRCRYWREHYTVEAVDGPWITSRWHGDAEVANPRPPRTTRHLTPLDIGDVVTVPAVR